VFFLLRDGAEIGRRVRRALPMDEEHKRLLLTKFTTVVRATVKGNIAVALVQGALGGLIFWFLGIDGVVLWGALMAFLSLLPAIGASLVWIPVALYFLMVGAIWKCVILVALRWRHRPGRQPAAPVAGRQGHQDARLGRADLDARRYGVVRHHRFCDRAAGRCALHGQLGHLCARAERMKLRPGGQPIALISARTADLRGGSGAR